MSNATQWNPIFKNILQTLRTGESTQLDFLQFSSKIFLTHFNCDALAMVFCHEEMNVLILATIAKTFSSVFAKVTGESLNEKSLTNHIDLCYDVLRRMIQFGFVHEMDAARLCNSTFFNPAFERVQSRAKSAWNFLPFSSVVSQTAAEIAKPEVNLSISEELVMQVRPGGATTGYILGKIRVETVKLPSLSRILVALEKSPDRTDLEPHFSAGIAPEFDAASARYDVRLDLPLLDHVVAQYDLENVQCPLKLRRKIRTREIDKLIELELSVESTLPKNVRMSAIKIAINLPPEHLNIRNCADHVGQSLTTADRGATWEIGHLFGSSSTDAIFSIAVSKVTKFQHFQLSNFSASFLVENFCVGGLAVAKFRVMGPGATQPLRQVRHFLFCKKANFCF